mmetsp:Transcript_7475/g.14167  ORF Transcript_7475/g.14167 Transcript_7475/m.14167 type:complete len:624 (+) Transcript_7475:100-1971(+)
MMRIGETIPNPLHDSALIHYGLSKGTNTLGSLFSDSALFSRSHNINSANRTSSSTSNSTSSTTTSAKTTNGNNIAIGEDIIASPSNMNSKTGSYSSSSPSPSCTASTVTTNHHNNNFKNNQNDNTMIGLHATASTSHPLSSTTSNSHSASTSMTSASGNANSVFAAARRASKNYGSTAGGSTGSLANLYGVAPPLVPPPVNNPINSSYMNNSHSHPTSSAHNHHQHSNMLQAFLWGDHHGTGSNTSASATNGNVKTSPNNNNNASSSGGGGDATFSGSSSWSQHHHQSLTHHHHQEQQQRRRSSSSLQLLQHANDLLFHSNLNIFQLPVEDFSTLDLLFGESNHGHQQQPSSQQHQQSNNTSSHHHHQQYHNQPHQHYHSSLQQQQKNGIPLNSKKGSSMGGADATNSDLATTNALSSISQLFSSATGAGGDYIQHQHHGGSTSNLGNHTGSGHPHEYQKIGSFSDCTTSSIKSRTEDKNNANGQQQNKKKRKKRPRGHPSRPLSAYNLFFKDERQRILDSLPSSKSSDTGRQEDLKDPRDEITWPGKRRRPHGKIGFENLAKEIGARWKGIDEETKEHYKKLALGDLQRYSREMQEYEGRLALAGVKLHKSSISSSDDDENE